MNISVEFPEISTPINKTAKYNLVSRLGASICGFGLGPAF